MEKKELSPLAKQLLNGAGALEMFTQSEFDDALAVAKAEIIAYAIVATQEAMYRERQACAEIAEEIAKEMEVEGEGSTGYIGYLLDCAERIRNRIPSQRQ